MLSITAETPPLLLVNQSIVLENNVDRSTKLKRLAICVGVRFVWSAKLEDHFLVWELWPLWHLSIGMIIQCTCK